MEWKKTRDGWDRWACFAAAMIIQACGGLGYTFAVYSQHLKETLGYDQEGLDDIGAAKDFGYSIGIVGGIFYNFIPPWLTVSIGALLHFMGYLAVYLTSAGRIEPSFWAISGFFAIGVGGDSWVDTAAIMTSIQNFPDYRGTALGLLKSQVGLSGAIFVALYKAFLKPNVDGYVFLVASAPAVASATLAALIRPFPSNDKDGVDSSADGRFQVAYGATVLLALYLLLSILLQAWVDVGRSWLIFFAVTMLTHCFFISISLALYRPCRRLLKSLISGTAENPEEMVCYQHSMMVKCSDAIVEEDNQPLNGETRNEVEQSREHGISLSCQTPLGKQGYHILDPVAEDVSKGGQDDFEDHSKAHHILPLCQETLKDMEVVTKQEYSEEQVGSYTSLQCLQSVNFWLLCFVAMTGPGSGLAIINNFGQIGRSLQSDSIELFVGLISVASCCGRLAAGYGSDLLLKLTPYPRPLCLTLAHLIMASGCSMLAAGYVPFLYLGSALVGGSYGAFWALTPVIIAEVFGVQNFPVLYKLIGACGPIGAYVLSAKLVGHYYDEEAEHYHERMSRDWHHYDDDRGANICLGRDCFGFSMLVLSVVCIMGASLGTVLSIRTRRLYLIRA